MSKKYHPKKVRVPVKSEQAYRSLWDRMLYDGEKKPWREVLCDPILRLSFVFIVLMLLIFPPLGLLNLMYSKQSVYKDCLFKVQAIEERTDGIFYWQENGSRDPILFPAPIPSEMADNITVGDIVLIWAKTSGTNKVTIISVERWHHA